jgi:hypothetical protein
LEAKARGNTVGWVPLEKPALRLDVVVVVVVVCVCVFVFCSRNRHRWQGKNRVSEEGGRLRSGDKRVRRRGVCAACGVECVLWCALQVCRALLYVVWLLRAVVHALLDVS